MSSSRLSLADLCQPTDAELPPSTTSSMASSSSSGPVHAGTKRPLNIDDQDEDVRIAVRALGDMRTMAVAHAHAPSAEAFAAAAKAHSRASSISQPTPLLTQSSTSASTSASSPISPYPDSVLPTPPEPREDDLVLDPSKDFVSRMTHLPIVNTAIKAYENSKERSRVVKYGAKFMESSVKTISRPVIDRLPVGQLDEFACRQLDRLGYPKQNVSLSDEMQLEDPSHHAYRDPPPPLSGSPSRAPSLAPSSADEYSAYGSPRRESQSFPEFREGEHEKESSRDRDEDRNPDSQVASRSKWQAMLLEAGGISAAVSEESMKRLQYCLQWLQYATAHIDSQILILRSFIDSLTPQPPHQNDTQALVSLQTMRSLTDVRRDVVSTIRQVVDVISKYAGGALPEPARASVRAFILRLPARWATANVDSSSAPPSPRTPAANPKYYRMAQPQDSVGAGSSTTPLPPHMRPTAGRGTHPTARAATQTAQKIMTLATESLDMMRSVTAVFKESLDRAEAWVERLRVVGIQRQGQSQGALPPPPSSAGPNPAPSRDPYPNHPPSPTMSLSSSMHSFTSLSLATQATTSPPTSIASGGEAGARGHLRTSSGEDAEGETETEDEGSRRRGEEEDVNRKGKGKGKERERERSGSGMDVDG